MSRAEERLIFPELDLHEILVPLSDCVCAYVGPVPTRFVAKLTASEFDFAPVLREAGSQSTVLGLISRERLNEIAEAGEKLSNDDRGIVTARGCGEIDHHVRLDALLTRMAERAAYLVGHEGDAGEYGTLSAVYGLVTRSDLNKHTIRTSIYQLLARLEIALAKLVRRWSIDPLTWIMRLSEENQARILGYWELSKLKGVDTGPVA